MLPSVFSVCKELCKEYENRTKNIIEETKVLKGLLKPRINNENKRFGANHNPVHRPSSARIKTSPQGRPASQRHSLSSPSSYSKSSPRRRNSVHESSEVPNSISSCELEEFLKTKAARDLLECSQSIEDYVEFRERPDKVTEIRRQRMLLEIENDWLQEYETFSIFEPDLAESLYKYLSILGKEGYETKKATECSIRSKIMNKPEVKGVEKFFEEAQKKINIALNEDLASIDFEKLKSDENKHKVVELHKTVAAVSDIRKLQSDVVYKKEPWHNFRPRN